MIIIMKTEHWVWFFLVIIFFFFRLYRLPQNLNFSADQGMGMLRAWEIWQNKEITLIGPTASPEIFGRQFFQGPLIYYFDLAIFLLADWNPLRSAYVLVGLNLGGLLLLYHTIKLLIDRRAALIGAWIFACLPIVVDFSRFHFGPSHLLYLTPLYLFILVKTLSSNQKAYQLLAGIIAGICLQFHFQSVIIIGLSCLYLWWKQKSLRWLARYALGWAIGYAPLLIFDLRHHFYNLSTIWLWFKLGRGSGFEFLPHRFLSFIPVIILIASYLLIQLKKNNGILFWLVLVGFTVLSFRNIFAPKGAFGMPEGWFYSDLVTCSQIVKEQSGERFNIVNLLSGDTRFYSMRALLTVQNRPPMPVDQYPSAKQLFILSYKNKEEVLQHPVWEIQSFLPAKIIHSWPVENGITLYQANKI